LNLTAEVNVAEGELDFSGVQLQSVSFL